MTDKKEKLVTAGRTVFYRKGFKATAVSEITEQADMAVGSFYKHYPSKEELFLDVFTKENEHQKQNLMLSVDPTEDPVSLATKLVVKNAQEMMENPILREWYNKELVSKMEAAYAKRGLGSIEAMLQGGMLQSIELWKAQGKMSRKIPTDMILGIFKAIPYIDLHKTEIGEELFPELLEHLTRLIMVGLTESE